MTRSDGVLEDVIDDWVHRLTALLPAAEVHVTVGVLVEGDAADDVDLVVLVSDVTAAATMLRTPVLRRSTRKSGGPTGLRFASLGGRKSMSS